MWRQRLFDSDRTPELIESDGVIRGPVGGELCDAVGLRSKRAEGPVGMGTQDQRRRLNHDPEAGVTERTLVVGGEESKMEARRGRQAHWAVRLERRRG